MDKKTEIVINVELDENNVPQRLHWDSTVEKQGGDCKSVFLSIWDEKEKNTLHLNLWTKDMLVDEMKQFIHQTLLGYADTIKKAAGDEKLANSLSDYCHEFALQAGILKKPELGK